MERDLHLKFSWIGKSIFCADLLKNFAVDLELMLSKLHAENPFCLVITDDFNCMSSQCWDNDIENNEGKLFEPLTSDLGLHQLISKAAHLMGDCRFCIDLIFNDQSNLLHCFWNCFWKTVSFEYTTSLQPQDWYYDKAMLLALWKVLKCFARKSILII